MQEKHPGKQKLIDNIVIDSINDKQFQISIFFGNRLFTVKYISKKLRVKTRLTQFFTQNQKHYSQFFLIGFFYELPPFYHFLKC